MDKTEEQIDTPTEIRHLLRTTKTFLELAIMSRAPVALVNRLARASGLLDAITQLPAEASPAREMTAELLVEATAATELWRAWEQTRTPSA